MSTYSDPTNPNSKTTAGPKRRHVGSSAFDPNNLPAGLREPANPVEKPKGKEKAR